MNTTFTGIFQGQPEWLPFVVALAVTFLVLAVGITLIARRRGKTPWLAGIGPQAVVALGGVAVSVHGLWGFARETAELSPWLAVAFIAVFDAAEMTLLVMLYRAADPAVGWTDELRLMHRTAWTLVAFSSLMNAVHAPNWWARPVMAAIPPLATWLIELQLRSKLHRPGTSREVEEGGRPGPMRLLLLAWQHAWAALFAGLGLDAGQSASGIAKAARAQKAARRVYRLRLALHAQGAGQGRGQRRVARRRRKSQKALDRADVATDTGQALAMVRRLAALTRADEVAKLDYADAPAVLNLLEGLAVTPAVASGRAEEAEGARQRAESARQEAEAARERAEAATAAARQRLEQLHEETEKAAEAERGARQRAATAREEEATARERAEEASEAAQQNVGEAHRLAVRDLNRLREEARTAQKTLSDLTTRARSAQEQTRQREVELEQVNSQVREASMLSERLRGDLTSLAVGAPEGAVSGEGPLFRSEAKQAGWEHYQTTLQHSGGTVEPTAGELAERFGVDGGNARNWVRDFRAARAAQVAARPPRTAARPTADGALTGVF